jgi:hypothetical protein
MHTRRPLTLLWITILAWTPGLCLSAAQVPVLAAHIDIHGQPTMLKVTPDQNAAVAVAWDGTDHTSEYGIALDLRTLSAPVVKSKFPIQGQVEQFEISPDGRRAMFLVKKGTGATSTREMVAMDLSDSKAVERWRREISSEQFFNSSQVAIASDASVYADSLSESAIAVKKASGEQMSFIGVPFSHRSAVKFSPDGRL